MIDDHLVGTAAQMPVRLLALLDAGQAVLGVDGLAVMLVDDRGSLRLTGASDGVSAWERAQLEAGMSPGLATPIPPVGPPLGTLNLFRHHGRAWDDHDRRSAAAYADVIDALLALTATERRRGNGA